MENTDGTLEKKKINKRNNNIEQKEKEEEWEKEKEGEIKIGEKDLEKWGPKTFTMAVDNETVAGIGTGNMRLRDKSVVPVFERVTRRIGSWLEEG